MARMSDDIYTHIKSSEYTDDKWKQNDFFFQKIVKLRKDSTSDRALDDLRLTPTVNGGFNMLVEEKLYASVVSISEKT